jgi:HEAT repeat protein
MLPGHVRLLVLLCTGLAWIAQARPSAAFDWIGKVERDGEGLSSANPQTRIEAVRSLAQYDIELARPYLLGALSDGEAKVRIAAGQILAHHRVKEAIPAVQGWLVDPDPAIKQAAARILGDLGAEESIGALVRSLGDADAQVRYQVVAALGRIGTPAVVVPLLGRLEDDKPDVRRGAIEELMKVGDERAVIPLVGAFHDSALDVRVAAVRAVGRLGDAAAVPALLRLLADPVDGVRVAAVAALGNLGAVRATERLIDELLHSRSTELRTKAAYALGQIARVDPSPGSGRGSALATLVGTLADPALRPAAHEALAVAGAAAVPALIAHLEGDLEGDPAAAVALLAAIGDARATPALIEELARGRVGRALVLDGLVRCGGADALLPVLGLLDDPDPDARRHAMHALRSLLDARAADVLVRHLDDEVTELAVLAAEYLGLIRAPAAVTRLVVLAGADPRFDLRQAAIAALGEIGDRRAVPALLAVLAGEPTALHASAADALITLGDDAAVDPLLAILREARPSAHHAVRALAGVLRGRADTTAARRARPVLEAMTEAEPLAVSLPAIRALGAVGYPESAAVLAELAGPNGTDADRRRVALAALGNLDAGASDALLVGLRARDDRVSGAAAWALGKQPGPRSRAEIEALFRATRRPTWATPINAAAALARVAEPVDAPGLLALLAHPDRFVRVNAAGAVRRLRLAAARTPLAMLGRGDPSPAVRLAAVRALGQIGGADDVLAAIASADQDERVRTAAGQSTAVFVPPPRDEWRSFAFVDPDRDNAPVLQEPYFLATSDGLVTALYTDADGAWVEEAFPAGDYRLAPRAEAERE